MSSEPLNQLLRRPDLWRPGEHRPLGKSGLPSGFSTLDAVLRGGGWPRGALVELLAGHAGAGELRLLLPVLAALGQGGLYQLWIDPPFVPFAPGLAAAGLDFAQLVVVRPNNHREWLWATEQALRSPGCGAVVCWTGINRSRYAELRKLQVAAAERDCVGFVFGSARTAEDASPAVLRLGLQPDPKGLAIEVLKQRGAPAGQRLLLEMPRELRSVAPLRERPAIVSAPRRSLRRPLSSVPQHGSVLRESWQ